MRKRFEWIGLNVKQKLVTWRDVTKDFAIFIGPDIEFLLGGVINSRTSPCFIGFLTRLF